MELLLRIKSSSLKQLYSNPIARGGCPQYPRLVVENPKTYFLRISAPKQGHGEKSALDDLVSGINLGIKNTVLATTSESRAVD